jgi:PGF-CTERM protein
MFYEAKKVRGLKTYLEKGEKMHKTESMQILIIALILSSMVAVTTAAQVSIHSDEVEIVADETVNLTVIAPVNHTITVSSNHPKYTVFPGGVNDNPESDTSSFDDVITKDAVIKKYALYFTNAGEYRVKVMDTNNNLEDYVDISVFEKTLTFNVPSTCIIGDVLNIKGNTNTGGSVDIAIDGVVTPEQNDIPIGKDLTFGIGIDTGAKNAPSTFKKSGPVRLKGFINREKGAGTITSDEEYDCDGSTAILMRSPSLSGEVSKKIVAKGDDFTISGTGVRQVEILIISPKGSDGRGIEGGRNSFPDCPGVTYYKLTPLLSDNSFSKKINVDYEARGGTYVVMVLGYGADGVYGNTEESNMVDAVPNLRGKTQDKVIAIIDDMCMAGDDLFWYSMIKVESPEVNLNPIEDIRIGDNLIVTGTCNKEDGAVIVITVEGPVELCPQAVTIENSKFKAVFDTSDAVVGTYIVRVDDGDGNIDETAVNVFSNPFETPKETPTYEYPSETPKIAPFPTTTSKTGDINVYLHGEKTNVIVGENIILSLSAVNLITKPTMTLQLILKVPSGMSITSTEFIESGAGQYTATYTVEPGKERHIGVNIKTNQAGDFNVDGDICYYFGGNKSTAEYKNIKLPVKVNPEPTPTPAGTTPTSSHMETPGFEGIVAIAGLLAVAYLVGRRK